jgi:hypothetical protein
MTYGRRQEDALSRGHEGAGMRIDLFSAVRASVVCPQPRIDALCVKCVVAAAEQATDSKDSTTGVSREEITHLRSVLTLVLS